MKNKTTLYGGIGAGIMAICCFTPVLVIVLTAIGLAGIIGYLDFILLPLLAFFLVLTAYGVYQAKADQKCNEPSEPTELK